MDPNDPTGQLGQGIVDTTSQYLDAQNKLNAQASALKQRKEEEESQAKLLKAMDQIQKQMDAE